MAWARTGMALVANGVLLSRQGLQAGPDLSGRLLLVVSAAIYLGYFTLFFIRSRQRQLARTGRYPLPLAEAQIIAILTVATSVGVAATGLDLLR